VLCSCFTWNGSNYSTFNLLSNYIDVHDDTTFKLWSGNGAKGEVLIENTTLITIPEPETELTHTIQTDKNTYNHNEIIHVTGKSSLVNRVQITHSNGDNIINAWLGIPTDNSYEYDIDLILYNGNNLIESSDYVINAKDGQIVLNSTIVYINVPEPEIAVIVENYTEPITTNEPPLTNGTTTVLSNSNYTEPEIVTELYTQKDQPIELWSDKSVYEDGSIIQIEGKINDGTSLIHVKVYNPSNFNIYDESYTVPNNGIFELNFDTSNYLWYENGIYLIQVEDIDGEKSQVEALVLDVALELESTQQNNTISQINSTSQFGDEVEQLREENKTLKEELERQREQIDELNEEVDYLKNIIESIQGFFGSIFG